MIVLLSLSIILIPKYYITGDGACHTYNAKVLFDMVLNRERDFYESFYHINRNIDPNWMSHLSIGVLLQFFPAWLADKIFQIVYLIIFAYGFRYLIKSINYNSSFLSFLFYPFVFSLPFQQGFYNYCIALGFMFFTLGYYIRSNSKMHLSRTQVVLSALLFITTMSHGMPAIYCLLILASHWLYLNYHHIVSWQRQKIVESASSLMMVIAPSLLIILLFLVKRGFGTEPHAWTFTQKLKAFLIVWTSQSTRAIEVYPAVASGLLILIFALIAFAKKNGIVGIWKYIFGGMALFTLYSYITCPHSIGGAGSIDIRLAFLPFLFLLLVISSFDFSAVAKRIFIALAFSMVVVFQLIRFPYVQQANEIGKSIVKAGTFIKDKSIVLNIHQDDWQQLGMNDSLFQRDGSFIHFSKFIGAESRKHLFFVFNYEAEINYFPVNYKEGINPRVSLSSMIPGNYPPCGNPLDYEKQIGKRIDYILIQNPRENTNCNESLLIEISKNFSLVYKNVYVKLYRRI